MAKWAGWGAGAAGAGAARPSRIFLVLALMGSGAAAVLLVREGRWGAAAIALAAAVYFALRVFAGLGRGRDEP